MLPEDPKLRHHCNTKVPLVGGVTVAIGTNDKIGSGLYSVDAQGETVGPEVEKLPA